MQLVFLGKFGELAPKGLASPTLPDDVRTLADLKDWIAGQAPVLGKAMALTTTRVAVNQALVHDLSRPVRAGDEIAFLPPVSGG